MKIEIKDGVVTNDGDEIGSITGDTCTLLAKASGPVKGAIRKAAGNPVLVFIAGTEEQRQQELEDYPLVTITAPFSTLSDDELAAEMKRRGLIQDAPPEAPVIEQPPVKGPDLSAVERLHKLAKEGKIPTPPVKHHAMGDKTPEYVAWFRTHATAEEIAIRYPDNRRVPASIAEFSAAEAKLYGKLPGEKKDTSKENDFINSAE